MRKGELTRIAILRAIEDLSQELGIPPSRREIAARVGKARTTVQYHIKILEERGLVTRIKGTARSVTLGPSQTQETG